MTTTATRTHEIARAWTRGVERGRLLGLARQTYGYPLPGYGALHESVRASASARA